MSLAVTLLQFEQGNTFFQTLPFHLKQLAGKHHAFESPAFGLRTRGEHLTFAEPLLLQYVCYYFKDL